jgi:hypothetical protein
MSREIELLEKQLAFWKHHAASLSKALDEAEQTANHYAQLLDKTEEELNAERVQREDVTDINVAGKSEWISVDERLPEEHKNVLCVEGNKTIIAFMEKVEDCDEFVPVFWDFVAYDRDDTWDEVCATHWMPIPEPPKMKGGVG